MSPPIHRRRTPRACVALTASLVLAAVPTFAHAAPVNLATTGSFAVLGGASVTNTGPSVLNGDLGVAPGTSLIGFALPAVVNGATHANDAVAAQAQADLTTAYDVAAGQPVPPANDLTGTDLGNRTLTAGAYRFTSSAQLTGALRLDAEGDPNAQFVFEIASTLTTASASSVQLVNGASPCNVFWQVGSSATIGTTTAFQGNLMALSDISLNTGATVLGRVLARNGGVTLDDNVINASMCATTPGGTPTTPGAVAGGSGQAPPASRTTLATRIGTARLIARPRTPGRSRGACVDGFRVAVRGRQIARVVFRLDGRRVATRTGSPFEALVRGSASSHRVTARVTFTDATRAKTVSFDYRGCAAAVLRPRVGPSRFTG